MTLNPVRRGGQPFSGHALEVWLRSPRGRRMLEIEDREMRRLLPEVFGRHVLQVGNWGREGELLASAETLHRAVLGTVDDRAAAAVVDPEHLPIETRSVDAVVLPHTLEFAHSPHNVLREVDRVLSDRGRLFVLGFNPWGWWAIRRLLGLRYRPFPEGARFYSVGRLFDWLELLDFEVAEVRRFGTGFPWQAPRSLGEPWTLATLLAPFADGYVLVAKKRVIPVSLVGRLQRAQVRPLVGMPSPAASRDTLFSGPATELPHPE
ncbi:MAG TPA: methyltransferase domain-containing protein [Solimonas sp.]|nr:methyltransferase domain-containing protein [Solimonas sp.]